MNIFFGGITNSMQRLKNILVWESQKVNDQGIMSMIEPTIAWAFLFYTTAELLYSMFREGSSDSKKVVPGIFS